MICHSEPKRLVSIEPFLLSRFARKNFFRKRYSNYYSHSIWKTEGIWNPLYTPVQIQTYTLYLYILSIPISLHYTVWVLQTGFGFIYKDFPYTVFHESPAFPDDPAGLSHCSGVMCMKIRYGPVFIPTWCCVFRTISFPLSRNGLDWESGSSRRWSLCRNELSSFQHLPVSL